MVSADAASRSTRVCSTVGPARPEEDGAQGRPAEAAPSLPTSHPPSWLALGGQKTPEAGGFGGLSSDSQSCPGPVLSLPHPHPWVRVNSLPWAWGLGFSWTWEAAPWGARLLQGSLQHPQSHPLHAALVWEGHEPTQTSGWEVGVAGTLVTLTNPQCRQLWGS